MASLKALVQQQTEEIERVKALLETEQQATSRAREDADSLSLALEESELKREHAEDESKRLKVSSTLARSLVMPLGSTGGACSTQGECRRER